MPADCADVRPWVVVFRLQLFKRSETFVAGQAQAFRRYRPVYVGWRRHGAAPPGAAVVCPPSPWAAFRLCVLGDPEAIRRVAGPSAIAVVHAHFGVDGVFARRLARRLGVPVVVTLHGFEVSRTRRALLSSLRPALVAYVFGWPGLARSAAHLIAVAPGVRRRALARGADPARLEVIPNGVDVGAFRPSGPGQPGLMVHVGRLVEKKGAGVLLRAFVEVAAADPGARLVLVGDGPLRAALVRTAADAGLEARVTFAGALAHADALHWMARASLVVVPSVEAADGDAEGLPTVLLEAAALARPIVASALDAVTEAVPADAVRTCPPGDASALARVLLDLLADPAAAAAMGARARAHVEAHYDLRSQSAAVEDLYDRIAQQPRRSGAPRP